MHSLRCTQLPHCEQSVTPGIKYREQQSRTAAAQRRDALSEESP